MLECENVCNRKSKIIESYRLFLLYVTIMGISSAISYISYQIASIQFGSPSGQESIPDLPMP